jgi:hypothetical protein
VGFINIRPTESDKAKHQALVGTPDDPLLAIDKILDGGYKISVTVDDRNRAIVATIYGHLKDCPNAGHGVSARASDALTALSRVCFMYFHVLPEKWVDADDSSDDW